MFHSMLILICSCMNHLLQCLQIMGFECGAFLWISPTSSFSMENKFKGNQESETGVIMVFIYIYIHTYVFIWSLYIYIWGIIYIEKVIYILGGFIYICIYITIYLPKSLASAFHLTSSDERWGEAEMHGGSVQAAPSETLRIEAVILGWETSPVPKELNWVSFLYRVPKTLR